MEMKDNNCAEHANFLFLSKITFWKVDNCNKFHDAIQMFHTIIRIKSKNCKKMELYLYPRFF